MPEPTSLQLRSLITASGELELSLASVPVPTPAAGEVLVRVEAAPINPSDLGLLFGAADLKTVKASGTPERPVITARVPDSAMRAMAGRVGQALPVGNEGAGTVIAAGAGDAAQALLGKRVAALAGGGMYAQHRCVPAESCLALPAGASAEQGASSFVNPLTVLGMLETMRREGHRALVHTAAASSLGQMLQKACAKDGVALVNIVRKPEQETLLRELGAKHVCNQGSPDFADALTEALAETGATLAFDATGGGTLASQILAAMESALSRSAKGYSRYGTSTHKQVYLYGGLDPRPTELSRTFGMAWGVGGWLVFPYLQKIGPAATQGLKDRVAAELATTFATRYAKRVSLAQALRPEEIAVYGQRTTGGKYLIVPGQP